MFGVVRIKGLPIFTTKGTNFIVVWRVALKYRFTTTFALFVKKSTISWRSVYVCHENLGRFRRNRRG